MSDMLRRARGRASLAQGGRPRKVVLPALKQDGFKSAACGKGKCGNCWSLRCSCGCHKRCMPVGDDHRCMKGGS